MRSDFKESFQKDAQTMPPSFTQDLRVNSKFSYFKSVSLYVHGGRDLKEGQLENMWRVDIKGI